MKDKNSEALVLSEEIIKNIELNEVPLRSIVLKCARLARLVNNTNAVDFFKYELAGYPTDDEGRVLYEAFELARLGNRRFRQKDPTDGQMKDYIFPQTVASLEAEVEAAREQMRVAQDRNISVSSANPTQYVLPGGGNTLERRALREVITETSKKLDQLRVGYYQFVLDIYSQLKFSSFAEAIFDRKRLSVNHSLGEKIPDALQKFVSVYENLSSDNPEDWANAVHSCRRLLKSVADYLEPPGDKEIVLPSGVKIKLDDDHYILRIKEYIKHQTESATFESVVGSHLDYIGNRLDTIYNATNKGTHDAISQEEAQRYVIYTYLMLSDILSLDANLRADTQQVADDDKVTSAPQEIEA
jgi:hypothetical protein